jgi:hypothetical protein
LNAVLIQPEDLPNPPPDLVSGDGIAKPLGSDNPDPGRLFRSSRQDGQNEVLSGPGFTRCLDQAKL